MSKFNEQYEKWLDECGESEPDPDSAFAAGWERCKEEVLKLLKEDRAGLDMNPNSFSHRIIQYSCDSYYIEKVEKL